MSKGNSGAKAADAAADSAEAQADLASNPTDPKLVAAAKEASGADATGIPDEDKPELPGVLLEEGTVLVPADTKAKKKVGVARQSANTWWCDNCDTGNMITTGKTTCGGCGGEVTLPER